MNQYQQQLYYQTYYNMLAQQQKMYGLGVQNFGTGNETIGTNYQYCISYLKLTVLIYI